MSSPTQRTLRWLRKLGWSACVVDKYNHFARVRQDAFGWGDILAYLPHKPQDAAAIASRLNMGDSKALPMPRGNQDSAPVLLPLCGIALVQCTSYTNLSTRVRKMRSNPHLEGWLAAGGHAIAIGWKPRKREPSVRVL